MSSTTEPSPWLSPSPILVAVQSGRVFNDSKDFVDAPLLVSRAECWRRWALLPQPPPSDALRKFVNDTFGPADSLLAPWTPPDHSTHPPLLSRLPAGAAREWARALNDLWPQLGRTQSDAVAAASERTTLLPLPRPFVVPGGRFREIYYWDSYWVVLGLLAVDMRETARDVTANLLHLAAAHGFVPNGARSYYLNRSQPPMLAQMVHALLLRGVHGEAPPRPPPAACTAAAAGAAAGRGPLAPLAPPAALEAAEAAAQAEFLRDALPVLDAEYRWWMRSGDNASAVRLPGMTVGALNRYIVHADAPRPESWREDNATAARRPSAAEPEATVYSELAAGAESGWDYSSRWLSDATELPTIRTSRVLPVDLNAILHRNELALAAMHAHHAALLGADAGAAAAAAAAAAAEGHRAAAAARRAAMRAAMWDGASGLWRDVLWPEASQLAEVSLASFTPLWGGAITDEAEAAAAVGALRTSGLVQPGGIATTLRATGEQWDWPNAWPPLQQMAIEGVANCGAPGGDAYARELATTWLRANHLGWQKDGQMHEKYDATKPGARGGGGEYAPQVGFGWSNGVVLWLLEKYGDLLGAAEEQQACVEDA